MKSMLVLFLLACATTSSHAADISKADAEAAVRAGDAAFWRAYNSCDTASIGDFFSEDVEFYHDNGGLTKTRASLVDSIKNNLCSKPDWHLRREAVAGSVKFYPMAGNRALLIGDHLFFITEKGKHEYPSGQAKFDHLWEYTDGRWRMTRVYSYAHGAPPYTPPAAIALAPAELAKFVGRYATKEHGDIDIRVEDTHLKMTASSLVLAIYPLAPTQFFAKERDLRFEFSELKGATFDRVVVRETGNVADEARRKAD